MTTSQSLWRSDGRTDGRKCGRREEEQRAGGRAESAILMHLARALPTNVIIIFSNGIVILKQNAKPSVFTQGGNVGKMKDIIADILLRFCLGTHWYLLVACPQKLTVHWLFMPVI